MSFEKSFKEVLQYEGGYSEHKYDRGGKTMLGITEEVAREHNYKGEMKDLTVREAKEIYKKDYWNKILLNQVDSLDENISCEMFDIAVNLGTRKASEFLQTAINVLSKNEIKVDAIIGSQTIDALNKLNSGRDKKAIVKILNILQGNHYIRISLKTKNFKVFFHGWLKRVKL